MALEEQTLKKGSDDADRSEKEDHKSHPVDALGYVAVRLNPVTRVGRESFRKHRKNAAAKADEPSRKTGPLAARRRRRTG